MTKPISLSTLLLAASSLVSCSAIPAIENNVARATLSEADITVHTKRFDNSFDTQCNGKVSEPDTEKLLRKDVKYCLDYLNGLTGTEYSPVSDWDFHETSDTICTFGSVGIYARSITPQPSTSLVTDIAAAVQWVYTNCDPNETHMRGGIAAANGNGNIKVLTGPAHNAF